MSAVGEDIILESELHIEKRELEPAIGEHLNVVKGYLRGEVVVDELLASCKGIVRDIESIQEKECRLQEVYDRLDTRERERRRFLHQLDIVIDPTTDAYDVEVESVMCDEEVEGEDA